MPMHNLNCNHPQPVFQRRHLNKLAEILNDQVRDSKLLPEDNDDYARTFRIVVRNVMDGLEKDNHLFDRGRFLAAVYDRD